MTEDFVGVHAPYRERKLTRSNRLVRGFATLLIVVPVAAIAQNAYTVRDANVRAGPDRTYPLVTRLASGAPLQVMGCLDDWSWCDVTFADNRGWMYGPNLSYLYENSRVPLYMYAPSLGIPVETFSVGVYWDEYYRQRPWYSGRDQWVQRAPPPHVRPAG